MRNNPRSKLGIVLRKRDQYRPELINIVYQDFIERKLHFIDKVCFHCQSLISFVEVFGEDVGKDFL